MQLKQNLKGLFSFITAIKEYRKAVKNKALLLEKIEKLEGLIQEERLKTEKLKSVFLNNIYHEIRTPMNSIIGFTDLLQQDNLTDNKKEDFIDKIKESSEDFLYTIDQLVEASLIETGLIKLNRENFNLDELFDSVYHTFIFRKHIKQKTEVALLKETDKYYPDLVIFADKEKLSQILINLIDNALKFTSKGIVEFGYKVTAENMLLFHITDSGIGIRENENLRIFEKFYKLNYVLNKENKGLGLGLCIAKELIKLFNGNIWIESNQYGGTTFKFIIPFEKPVFLKETEQQGCRNQLIVT